MDAPIYRGNDFLVSANGNDIVILNPPHAGQHLTKADALLLAAWLVVLAEEDAGEFEAIHTAICQS
jgi:hypothetical protein